MAGLDQWIIAVGTSLSAFFFLISLIITCFSSAKQAKSRETHHREVLKARREEFEKDLEARKNQFAEELKIRKKEFLWEKRREFFDRYEALVQDIIKHFHIIYRKIDFVSFFALFDDEYHKYQTHKTKKYDFLEFIVKNDLTLDNIGEFKRLLSTFLSTNLFIENCFTSKFVKNTDEAFIVSDELYGKLYSLHPTAELSILSISPDIQNTMKDIKILFDSYKRAVYDVNGFDDIITRLKDAYLKEADKEADQNLLQALIRVKERIENVKIFYQFWGIYSGGYGAYKLRQELKNLITKELQL
jgi:hypothetical protein